MISMGILENGSRIKRMDVVLTFILTGRDMKVVGLKIKNKEKEHIDIGMVMYMMGYGKMIEGMDKVR
jgi:hypothetical protein